VVLQIKLLLAGAAWHLRSLMRESQGLSVLLVPIENDMRGRRVLDKQQLQRVPVEPAHERVLQQLGVVPPSDFRTRPDPQAMKQMRLDASNWLMAAANLVDALISPQPANAALSPADAFLARCSEGWSAATYADAEMLSLELPPLMMQCVLLLPEAYASIAAVLVGALVKPLLVQLRVLPQVTHTTAAAAQDAFLARRRQAALQMLRVLLCHILPAISAIKRRTQELVQPQYVEHLELCLASLPDILLEAASGALSHV
jgi:hypothetical protein